MQIKLDVIFFSLTGKDRLDIDEDSLGRCPLRNGCSNGLVTDSNGAGTGSFSNNSNNNNSFLGPLLWERTLPCDGGLFQLQYMDLEEFLTENGMSSMHNTSNSTSAQIPSQSSQSAIPNQGSQCLPTSPPHCSSSSSPTSATASSPSLLGLDMHTPQSMMGSGDCLHGELCPVSTHLHPFSGVRSQAVSQDTLWFSLGFSTGLL